MLNTSAVRECNDYAVKCWKQACDLFSCSETVKTFTVRTESVISTRVHISRHFCARAKGQARSRLFSSCFAVYFWHPRRAAAAVQVAGTRHCPRCHYNCWYSIIIIHIMWQKFLYVKHKHSFISSYYLPVYNLKKKKLICLVLLKSVLISIRLEIWIQLFTWQLLNRLVCRKLILFFN